jgi:hypothetical protein
VWRDKGYEPVKERSEGKTRETNQSMGRKGSKGRWRDKEIIKIQKNQKECVNKFKKERGNGEKNPSVQ